jgi:phospholipase/lecithinase/hemolysin
MPGFRRLALAVLLAPWLLPVLLSAPASAATYSGLVVLGDSLSDQGNMLAATAALGPGLGGSTPQPDPAAYYQGRFSNGPVYTDVLAKDLGVSLTPSLDGGTNFAFGGARTDYNTVEVPPYGTQIFPREAYPWSLNGERQAFTAYAAANGANPNALYVVFSGSNDVFDIVARGMPVASTIANAVAGIINVVDAFKAAGAKTVLVPNLPDLGVVPKVTSLEPVDPGISAYVTLLTMEFNTALAAALDAQTGVNIIQFDTFDLLKDVVADPTAYGFTNSTDACYSGFVLPDPTATTCANSNQYVFWDNEHPTTAFATLLGNDFFAAVTDVPEPASVGLLGGGLVVLAGLRRRLSAF